MKMKNVVTKIKRQIVTIKCIECNVPSLEIELFYIFTKLSIQSASTLNILRPSTKSKPSGFFRERASTRSAQVRLRRHRPSTWKCRNRFTGSTNCNLSWVVAGRILRLTWLHSHRTLPSRYCRPSRRTMRRASSHRGGEENFEGKADRIWSFCLGIC